MKRAWLAAVVDHSSSDEGEPDAAPSALSGLGAWRRAALDEDSAGGSAEGADASPPPAAPRRVHPGWRQSLVALATPSRRVAATDHVVSSAGSEESAASAAATAPKRRGRPLGRAAARRMETATSALRSEETLLVDELATRSAPAVAAVALGRAASSTSLRLPRTSSDRALGGLPALELAVRLPRVENMGIYEPSVAALHAVLEASRADDPSFQVDPSTAAVVESLLGAAVGRACMSGRVEGEQHSRSRQRMRRLKHWAAASVLALTHSELAELRCDLRSLALQHPEDFSVVLDIAGRSYDETPTKLRIKGEGKTTAKILQSDVHWGFLLMVRVRADLVEYLLVRGRSYAALQAVERTTAECTRRAIELQCPTLYDCAAEKKVHIVAMDGASSNTKCEGAILEEAPPRVAESGHPVASLRTNCAVHRAQAVIKSTARLVPTTASGVLNMGLSLRASGAMSVLRRILAEVFEERLRVKRGDPPAAVQTRNRQLAHIFLARSAPKRRRMVAMLALLANGTWELEWFDDDAVHHYCPGPWCCADASATLAKFLRYLVPALAGGTFAIFAQSRWQGSHNAIDQQGLFANLHGLLGIVYERWARIQDRWELSRGAQSSASQRPEPMLPLADIEGCDEDAPPSGGEDLAAPEPAGCSATATSAPDIDPDVDAVDVWRREQKAFRAKALAYIARAERPCDKLLLLRLVMEPQARMMDALLRMGSRRWEDKELRNELKSGARAYRITELGSGRLEERCLRQVSSFLMHDGLLVSQLSKTTAFRSLAFRMSARLGAATYFYATIPHKCAPYSIFRLLDNPSSVGSLLSLKPCQLDSYTKSHLQAFPTAEDLLSVPSLVQLRAVASLVEVDIAARECGHAHCRRVKELRSVQTHSIALEDLSAEFVSHAFRKAGASSHGLAVSANPASGGRDGARPRPRGGTSRKKGGGAWRAFVHMRAQGAGGLLDVRQLATEYRALSAEDMSRYVALGKAATAALRAGAQRAFATSDAQLQRAAAKRSSIANGLGALGSDATVSAAESMACSAAESVDHQMNAVTALATQANRLAREEADTVVRELSEYRDSLGSEALQRVLARVPALARRMATSLHPVPHRTPALVAYDRALVVSATRVVAALESRQLVGSGLTQALPSLWERSHDVIMHDDCAPVKGKYPISPCVRVGMCVCEGLGKRADQRWRKLTSKLKRAFPKKEKRLLLVGGHVVAQLRLELPTCGERGGDSAAEWSDDRAHEIYFSVAFISLSPTAAVVLELVNMRPCPESEESVLFDIKFSDGDAAFSSAHELLLAIDADWGASARFLRLVAEGEDRPLNSLRPGEVEAVYCSDEWVPVWPSKKPRRVGARRAPRRALPDRGSESDSEGGSVGEADDRLVDDEPASAESSDGGNELSAAPSEGDLLRMLFSDSDDSAPRAAGVGEPLAGGAGVDHMGANPFDDPIDDALGRFFDGSVERDPESDRSEPHALPDVGVEEALDMDVGDVTDVDDGPPLAVGLDAGVDARPAAPAPAGDIVAIAAADPIPAAPLEMRVRMPHLRVDWVDAWGHTHSIRHNAVDNDFIAYCGTHGPTCRRHKTANPGAKAGAGRPLGFLSAWLEDSHLYEDKGSHVRVKPSELAHDRRSAARATFVTRAGAAVMLALEIPKTEGDHDEPERIA